MQRKNYRYLIALSERGTELRESQSRGLDDLRPGLTENEPSSRTDATSFLFERWGAKTSKLFVNCLRNREGEHVATARADDLNARRQTLSIQPGGNRRCRQPTDRRKRDPVQHFNVGSLASVGTLECTPPDRSLIMRKGGWRRNGGEEHVKSHEKSSHGVGQLCPSVVSLQPFPMACGVGQDALRPR